jgi:hypothetical protein
MVDMFLTFLEGLYQTPFDPYRTDILLLFKILYDLDFEVKLKNTSNKDLLIQIMHYGFNLKTFSDTELAKQCHASKDVCAIACYNKLSSYKFYINGTLPDLLIYSHFGHFFVPKYVTSSGRLFSHVLFLQLQGNKFVLNFLRFGTVNKLKESQYLKLRDSVVQSLPHLLQNNPLKDLPFTTFEKTNRSLFVAYIQSYIKNGVDLNKDFISKNNPLE